MTVKKNNVVIKDEVLMNKILVVRGQKVMIDKDLAELYGTTTFRLNEQVKRNIKRFPADFMFQLTVKEKNEVIANCDNLQSLKFSAHLPFVFTEHGAVMLASVLNSQRAVEVNIRIVRVFIKMREILLVHKDVLLKIEQIEKRIDSQDEKILVLFDYLKQLVSDKKKPRKAIGYRISKRK
jgi:hypothetical protein